MDCRKDVARDEWIIGLVYRRFIHIISCFLVPEIWKDWDERWKKNKGEFKSVDSRQLSEVKRRMPLRNSFYQSQWRSAQVEYKQLVMFYCAENIFLSCPYLYTCMCHIYRHAIVTPLDVELPMVIASYIFVFLIPGKNEKLKKNN